MNLKKSKKNNHKEILENKTKTNKGWMSSHTKNNALKGLYRAFIISLGVLSGALGFKRGIDSQLNNNAKIDSMIDNNNNDSLNDNPKNSKLGNDIKWKNMGDSTKDNQLKTGAEWKSFGDSIEWNNIEYSEKGNKLQDTAGYNKQEDGTEIVSQETDNKSNNKNESDSFEDRIVVKKNNKNDSKDLEKERLSKIKVGSRFKIDSGKYFEKATGEGESGSFEKQDKSPRVMSLIKITTKNGNNILIQNDDKNLYQLKSQYPKAKFSYHFTDTKGNAYGWVTKDSFVSKLQKENKIKVKKQKNRDKDEFDYEER